MRPNLVTRVVGDILILVESSEPPSDQEWDHCLSLLAGFRSDFSRAKILVVTEGGGPTPLQRQRLSELSKGHHLRVAVVSESVKVRFIVSSVALFLRDISSFRRSELIAAYKHLRLDYLEQRAADRAVSEMTLEIREVGPPAAHGTSR